MDPIEKTKEFVDNLGVTYSVACGMDAMAVCELTGAFYEEERNIIQPTGILVRPDKTIAVAGYSSGPIGRFVPQDVLKLVEIYKGRDKR